MERTIIEALLRYDPDYWRYFLPNISTEVSQLHFNLRLNTWFNARNLEQSETLQHSLWGINYERLDEVMKEWIGERSLAYFVINPGHDYCFECRPSDDHKKTFAILPFTSENAADVMQTNICIKCGKNSYKIVNPLTNFYYST